MPADRMPTKASELRRSTKPIMEKRRRARINHSLSELKNLILDALKKDNARHSKLEKADILEMTVKHLQNLQRQQVATNIATDPTIIDKYRAGFNECASEVSRYLSRIDGVDQSVRQRLLNHLASCLSSFSTPPPSPQQTTVGYATPTATPLPLTVTKVPEAVNPSTHAIPMGGKLVNGLQLVPTRLPTGEIAFLLPTQGLSSQLSVFTSAIPSGAIASGPMTATTPAPSPINVLGSSGILSPAASDRSSGSPSPVSPVQSHFASSVPYAVMAMKHHEVKVEAENVWRPW